MEFTHLKSSTFKISQLCEKQHRASEYENLLQFMVHCSFLTGSGCLSPEGEGVQPAISVQSFVLCVGLAVS